ncbi:MAG: MGMT family protein, partial [Spirochaetales bacterium]|nr:MGMT family protein [Spirochaetales bacterium]
VFRRLPKRETNMAYKRKSWQEKMADKEGLPKVLALEPNFPCFKAVSRMGAKAGDTCVLVNTREVAAVMQEVSAGKLMTIHEICKKIARNHGVAASCTLTTGIEIMITANAVEEMKKEGKRNDTPYWRTLKADGFLNEKYPGGAEKHKELLEREGFEVARKGNRYFVSDFRKYLTEG